MNIKQRLAVIEQAFNPPPIQRHFVFVGSCGYDDETELKAYDYCNSIVTRFENESLEQFQQRAKQVFIENYHTQIMPVFIVDAVYN